MCMLYDMCMLYFNILSFCHCSARKVQSPDLFLMMKSIEFVVYYLEIDKRMYYIYDFTHINNF